MPQRPTSLSPIPISAMSARPNVPSDLIHVPPDIFSPRSRSNRPISRWDCRKMSHLSPAQSEFRKSGPLTALSVRAGAANSSSLFSPKSLTKMPLNQIYAQSRRTCLAFWPQKYSAPFSSSPTRSEHAHSPQTHTYRPQESAQEWGLLFFGQSRLFPVGNGQFEISSNCPPPPFPY